MRATFLAYHPIPCQYELHDSLAPASDAVIVTIDHFLAEDINVSPFELYALLSRSHKPAEVCSICHTCWIAHMHLVKILYTKDYGWKDESNLEELSAESGDGGL